MENRGLTTHEFDYVVKMVLLELSRSTRTAHIATTSGEEVSLTVLHLTDPSMPSTNIVDCMEARGVERTDLQNVATVTKRILDKIVEDNETTIRWSPLQQERYKELVNLKTPVAV